MERKMRSFKNTYKYVHHENKLLISYIKIISLKNSKNSNQITYMHHSLHFSNLSFATIICDHSLFIDIPNT